MKKLILMYFLLFFGIFAQASDYVEYKLDNGHKFVIKKVTNNPSVIIDTWVKTGSINENDKNNGVAHFLEHMFFKGSKNYPNNQFDKILESKGALTNAGTSKDFTHYYVKIPSKDFPLALKLHFDMLQNPLLPKDELEKERMVVLEEISRGKDSHKNILYKNLIKQLYKNHPYHYEVIGEEKIIKNITQEEMFEFYHNWYTPENMITVIVGDIDPNIVINEIKQSYSKEFKNSKIAKPKYVNDSLLNKASRKIEYSNVENGYYLLGFRTLKPNSKDIYTLDVLSVILGEGRSSRLYQNIKDKKQLAYSIYSSNSINMDDGLFYIMSEFSPDNLENLEINIKNEIENIKKYGVTNEELNRAKKMIENNVYYSRESISNIANEIGYSYIITGDIKFYNNYINNIKNVKVNDIKEAANRYLKFNSSATSIILPKSTKMKKNNEHPISSLNQEAKLIKKIDTISKYELANGAILLINKNTNNNIIGMQIFDTGGYFKENIPGISEVYSSVMMKGTKKYSFVDLNTIMEENGIEIMPNVTPDTFSISLKVTEPRLNLALDILDEVINNPKLDEYEIEKVKREKIASIKSSRDNPMNIAFEEFKNLMWKNTPYNRSGKVLEKTIIKVTKNDLNCFHQTVFDPKNTVISINGNVNENQMIKYFTNVFKNNNCEKINLSDYRNYFSFEHKKNEVNVKKDSNTSWVILGWKTDGILNYKDWATLKVIDSILGQGMSSRLFNNLRNAQGLAYQIGSTYGANYNSGAFAIYIGTNPKTVEHSKREMLKEINRLKTQFVLDKELKEAKEKIIGKYLISIETNNDKASTLGWYEVSGRTFEFDKYFPELINSVTSQDIIYIANKYFNNNYILSVVQP